MTACPADPPRFCRCRDGRRRWPILDGDRNCSGCGRLLLTVDPLGLKMGTEVRSGVACHLRRSVVNRSITVGKLLLTTTAADSAHVAASCVVLSGPAIRTLRVVRPRSGEIEIVLEFPDPASTSGLLARVVVTLDVGGELFDLPVSAYTVDTLAGSRESSGGPASPRRGPGWSSIGASRR